MKRECLVIEEPDFLEPCLFCDKLADGVCDNCGVFICSDHTALGSLPGARHICLDCHKDTINQIEQNR